MNTDNIKAVKVIKVDNGFILASDKDTTFIADDWSEVISILCEMFDEEDLGDGPMTPITPQDELS